jgi:UDP-glucose 4-epimerase
MKYYQNNVCNTLVLLEAMLSNGVKKIIFSSTCATYGNPQKLPITEIHPQIPINPYGRSKLYTEQILSDFKQSYGLEFIAFRYFNAAGADHECEIGEKHDPETHLIPLLLDVAIGRRTHITINGNDYETPDGTCVRDYLHVTDIAQAHVFGLKLLLDSGDRQGNFYNLANNRGHSVLEVISCVESICKNKINIKFGPRRLGDPAILIGDASKAKCDLGWSPKYSGLEEIIETAWRWHKKMIGM